MKKKVLVVGNYKKEPSEGMEVITKRLVDVLQVKGFDVRTVTTKHLVLLLPFYVYRFNRVIFTHGPGSGVYYLSILISILRGPCITWLATRPIIKTNKFTDSWLSKLDQIYCGKENKVLKNIANTVGASFNKVIIGTDTSRVIKTDFDHDQVKRELMGEFVDLKVPLVLHVGHLRHNRGLEKLIKIKEKLGDRVNVLVIGSPSLSKDKDIIKRLRDSGIYIYDKYLKNLDKVYQAADLYVFTVDPKKGGAIDLPLSVIEALACGTPVISTSFGVLKDYLKDHPGIIFEDIKFEESVISFLDDKNRNFFVSSDLPKEFDLDFLIEEIIKNI